MKPVKGEDDEEIAPRRKDYKGIAPIIDTIATSALRKGQLSKMKKCKFEGLVDLRVKGDGFLEQTLESINAGSIRGAARLYKAGLVKSPMCSLCNNEKETQEHIFWKCPALHEIREPYAKATDELVNRQSDQREEREYMVKECPAF